MTTLKMELDTHSKSTEGFTSSGRIALHLTGRESPQELLHLLLHELAHFTTGEGHSEVWWAEASRFYKAFGIYKFAKTTEIVWEELWPQGRCC